MFDYTYVCVNFMKAIKIRILTNSLMVLWPYVIFVYLSLTGILQVLLEQINTLIVADYNGLPFFFIQNNTRYLLTQYIIPIMFVYFDQSFNFIHIFNSKKLMLVILC